MGDLLPCPFCGGEAFIFRKTEACCKDEDCPGWTVNHCSIEKWNTRALPAASPEAVLSAGGNQHFDQQNKAEEVVLDGERGHLSATEAGASDGVEAPAHAEPVTLVIRHSSGKLMFVERPIKAHGAWSDAFPVYAHPPTDAAEIERLTKRVEKVEAAYKTARKIIAKVYNRVATVAQMIEDDGDRQFFGSSNDADVLRDLKDEWDAHKVMGEDILTSEQEAAAYKTHAEKAEAEVEERHQLHLEQVRITNEWIERYDKAEAALSESQALLAMWPEVAAQTLDTRGDGVVDEALGQQLCCSGQDCGCRGADVCSFLQYLIRDLTPADAQAALDARINAAREEGRVMGLREAADLVRAETKTSWVGGIKTTINVDPLADAILAAAEKEAGK